MLVGRSCSGIVARWSQVFVWHCFFSVLMAHVLYGRPPVQLNLQSDICSGVMPCRWAICPWSSRAVFSRSECHPISNTICHCDRGLRCAIDMASIQAVAHGNQHSIKYSYYCRRPDQLASYRQRQASTIASSMEIEHHPNVVIT